MSNRKKTILGLGAVLALTAGVLTSLQIGSKAQAQNDADPGKALRCATRLSVAFLGTAPSPALLQSTDPQSQVDALISDPLFQERFARFTNSLMNDSPGATSEEDGAYHLSKYILQNAKPWKELFNGPYNIVATGAAANRVVSVQPDVNGLGYFRSQAWLLRYAGNELTGVKLNSAYRLLNNVVGLHLTATTNAPGADVSATGRAAPACKACHYDGWYALDKTAQVLTKVQRQGNNVTFTPVDGTPKEVLGGLMLKDDKELVNAMVDSEQFAFNACRTAFKYLYGREENACEAAVFDRCVESIKTSGMIQSALSTVAKDPAFCQ
ncbi:MAG TPA: hypothetical protein VE954_15395 [Oligoflexus sp.]|uniref:hypothetical protein n=1 Tax=Oligoflexus sp. TaxID=1971216 RepID=UPI002D22FB96|nr:hypothetical protein [Oligoflexus sp.]HYX34488.1 hypothetical protein [Oligoflexus sp.]